MIIEAIGAAVATFVLMITSNIISTRLRLTRVLRLVVQVSVVAAVAGAAYNMGFLPLIIAALMAAFPVTLNALTYLVISWQQRKARQGDYGDEVKWAIDLIDSGDDYFAYVINQMSRSEMREIGIIAESKEELRRLTIERFEEETDTSIPEEFAS